MDFGTSAPLGIALLGLLLGMRHATDPDHVIAVTAILSGERRLVAAARVGLVWGLGHSLTMLGMGMAIIVFKLAIPARLGLAMEFAVAIVLILLGLGAAGVILRGVARRWLGLAPSGNAPLVVHSHLHVHDGAAHRHVHVHSHPHAHSDGAGGIDSGCGAAASAAHHDHRLPPGVPAPFAARRPLARSFAVGLVHGLAGSAAIALLVLSAIPRPLWATLYLVVFCAGTIIGMGLITTAIATPLLAASGRIGSLHQRFITGSGLLSFGFGLFLAYRIGVVDGLFGSCVTWTPH